MGNVVPLNGNLPIKGEPDPAIVEQIENLLQEAKDGWIVSFAYAYYWPTDCTGHGWCVGAYGFHLAAAILTLQHAFCEMLAERATDQ